MNFDNFVLTNCLKNRGKQKFIIKWATELTKSDYINLTNECRCSILKEIINVDSEDENLINDILKLSVEINNLNWLLKYSITYKI